VSESKSRGGFEDFGSDAYVGGSVGAKEEWDVPEDGTRKQKLARGCGKKHSCGTSTNLMTGLKVLKERGSFGHRFLRKKKCRQRKRKKHIHFTCKVKKVLG